MLLASKTVCNGRNGFTLIELLVVVLIIGILAAVALPGYQVAVEKSKITPKLLAAKTLLNAQKLFFLENGYYTMDMDLLDVNFPYIRKVEYETKTDYVIGKDLGLTLYTSGNLCVFSGKGYVIDYYGTNGVCYPLNDTYHDFGEKYVVVWGKKQNE